MAKGFPGLDLELQRAEVDMKAEDYLAVSMFFSFYNFIVFFGGLLYLLWLLNMFTQQFIIIFFLASLAFSVFGFVYMVSYPKISVRKKSQDLDKNLIFAIRHLLVKVRSGVPLYEALVGVSQGNYGSVSNEIEKAVKEMQGGVSEATALDKVARLNPSTYFRRTIWQITNALRSGADISSTLSSIEENAINEQKIRISQYGAEMNPFAVIYMMLTVILPTLGITFLIIIGSFLGLIFPDFVFYLILVFLAFFQYMFIGIIKSRRPVV
jgi:flagellar protein FlaJ